MDGSDKDVSNSSFLKATQWLAKNFSRPFAGSAVIQGLPVDYEQMGIHILPSILEAVGLKSHFKTLSISNIDPAILPCVLFTHEGQPVVLKKITQDGKSCELVSFQDEAVTTVEPFKAVRKLFQKEVLLVSIDSDVLSTHKDESATGKNNKTPHWFWRPVRRHWGAWFQILIAAFGTNILGLALPIFVMNVYDRVIPSLALVTLWTLAIGVSIALFFDLILKLVRTRILERAGRQIDLKIASDLFKHAMNIRLLERKGGAATIANQIRDFEAVRDFFTSSSFVSVIDLFFIGIFVFFLWVIVGPIAIVPLLAVPLVIVIAFIAQIPIGNSVERMQQLSSKKYLVLIESLLGVETIKSLNAQPVMQKEWENAVSASSQINSRTKFWSNFAISSTMLIQQSVSVIIIIWGVYLVSAGEITVGALIAANLLAGRVLAPLGNISQTLVRARQATNSLSSISQYMKIPTESDNVVQSELCVSKGALEFNNVSLKYPDSQVDAISEFSLKITPGESIGLLGRVGSGKTTIGKLFSGLIQPDTGIILVDGHEIQQYEPSVLRDGLGYLPQDPEMFTGTIRENILLGRPDATEEEIRQALYYSGMDYFISESPEGLNQFIGEKGDRLSGGQRQSISLARLILRRPPVMFLDEPTNAMDHTTETIITSRLKELINEGTTLIVSTHRHSITNILDRLVIIDKGKKILDGKRDAVLKHLAKET